MTNQEARFDLNDGSEILIEDTPDNALEGGRLFGTALRQVLYARDVHWTDRVSFLSLAIRCLRYPRPATAFRHPIR